MRVAARCLLVALVASLAAALATGSAAAQTASTVLQVSAPAAASVGDRLELRVSLRTALGEPVEGARVTLTERAGFMDTSTQEVAVASATTDADGEAVLRFMARREGTRSLTARYDGDDDLAAASVTLDLPVAAGVQTYIVESQPGIPGVNRFLLMSVLVIVWGTMFIVAAHVLLIAREGFSEGSEGRE